MSTCAGFTSLEVACVMAEAVGVQSTCACPSIAGLSSQHSEFTCRRPFMTSNEVVLGSKVFRSSFGMAAVRNAAQRSRYVTGSRASFLECCSMLQLMLWTDVDGYQTAIIFKSTMPCHSKPQPSSFYHKWMRSDLHKLPLHGHTCATPRRCQKARLCQARPLTSPSAFRPKLQPRAGGGVHVQDGGNVRHNGSLSFEARRTQLCAIFLRAV